MVCAWAEVSPERSCRTPFAVSQRVRPSKTLEMGCISGALLKQSADRLRACAPACARAGNAGEGPALSEEEVERARQARLERFQPLIPPPDTPAGKDDAAKKAD